MRDLAFILVTLLFSSCGYATFYFSISLGEDNVVLLYSAREHLYVCLYMYRYTSVSEESPFFILR